MWQPEGPRLRRPFFGTQQIVSGLRDLRSEPVKGIHKAQEGKGRRSLGTGCRKERLAFCRLWIRGKETEGRKESRGGVPH